MEIITTNSKPHYAILDGLRGVAALMVVCFHLFEAFATNPANQIINHGYLAVDFFFLLSGFVVGYAYDGRPMSVSDFLKRRLIRLHPMVIAGAVIGGATYFVGARWSEHIAETSVGALLLAVALNMLLLPSPRGIEPRGSGEMFALNGPSWSLFFEYLGNLLYILFVRRLSTKALAVLVGLAGVALGWYALGNISGWSHIGVGWTLTESEFGGGSLRVLFSFTAGLLLSRIFRPWRVRNAFLWCSLAVVVLLAMPRLFEPNGIYDIVCCLVIFPLILWAGASGVLRRGARLCKFLGEISYPLYIVHYPFMYLYYLWVWSNKLTFLQSLPGALAVVVVSVAVAWGLLKVYDMPIRKWLTNKNKQI